MVPFTLTGYRARGTDWNWEDIKKEGKTFHVFDLLIFCGPSWAMLIL
jgi:hypothetical protein